MDNNEHYIAKFKKPIVLYGEDALKFIRSIYRPTKEEVSKYKQQIDEIEREIKVEYTENGYIATIDGLNLSFLDNE